ncbi:Cinnamate beta-D-glucosyltransferase [Morella rubra]|uniref:Cinnamate beta-D-glucosyltransferase n=1 Tax=Morella rubra TaxID=262757 RepID=A0A6A1WAN6_9ROSI|nr:Cinnamate beta-D-glucosyltransferase [Morella rubra]KAB1220760.1 Cinnamate beta-D-glucosyltransferase [Morella rubra]
MGNRETCTKSLSKVSRVEVHFSHLYRPGQAVSNFMKADDCMELLDSKPTQSVVYVSFGSVVYLTQARVVEIAYGILDFGVSFLWVMKAPHKDSGYKLGNGFRPKRVCAEECKDMIQILKRTSND